MATKKEPTISEQQVQEILERMGRKESRERTSLNELYKHIGLESDRPEQTEAPNTLKTGNSVTEEAGNGVLEGSQVICPKRRQCRRGASAASSAGCRWTSTAPPTCKYPRLQTASPCSSAARFATGWTGLSATSEAEA